MKDDLKFTLHEYHDEIKEGNLLAEKVLPLQIQCVFRRNVYIDAADADAAISFENMDGYMKNSIYDENDSNKVVGYYCYYTKKVLVLRIQKNSLMTGLKSNSKQR